MDTSYSVPPPRRPLPAAAARPVGDLKRLDGKRVGARLLDSAILLPISLVAARTQDEGIYLPLLLATLLYFFLCEATSAQTLGKRKLGLRVMQRDGSPPTVNQVSVRTVLRLIDDGPIGLIVLVLSGKRRQRIGDLLAGTTVGPADATVAKPASSPLLVIYPVGWLIAAGVWLFAGSAVREEEAYLSAAQSICARTAAATAPLSAEQWIPQLESQYSQHAALTAPTSLRAVHAELLAVERADLQIGRRFVAAEQRGDRAAAARLATRGAELNQRRQALADAGLPACA